MHKQLYPWQTATWEHLTEIATKNKLPHALLFYGLAGLGKTDFVATFSKYLLCDSQLKQACDHCASCRLINAGTHPDLHIIQPLEESKMIKIDQIRDLPDFIYNKSYAGKYKIIIINPAEAMNLAAANALLKLLEEPADNVIMMLISNNSEWLSATVRSRCQAHFFPPLTATQFKQWYPDINYRLSFGAPLRFKDYSQQRQLLYQGMLDLCENKISPIELSQTVKEIEWIDFIESFSLWIYDAILVKLNASQQLLNQDLQLLCAQFSAAIDIMKLYAVYDKLLEIRNGLKQSLNFNKQLWIEELFIFIMAK